MSSNSYHHIPVKPETADELYERKRRGESWDETVRKLLDDE